MARPVRSSQAYERVQAVSLPPDLADLVGLLVERKVLPLEALCTDELVVREYPGRHRRVHIWMGEEDPGLLIKLPWQPARLAEAIAHEADVYAWAGTHRWLPGLDLFPECRLADPATPILVLELLAPIESLRNHYGRHREVPIRTASALGSQLGSLHRETDLAVGSVNLPPAAPWVFGLRGCDPSDLGPAKPSVDFVFDTLAAHPTFADQLDALAADWRPRCLVHGDLRAENWLVHLGEPPSLRLVDWELAGLGEPAWDVGSVLQDLLVLEVVALSSLVDALDPCFAPAATESRIRRLHPAARSFWTSYCASVNWKDQHSAEDFLKRSIRLAGARLIQSCLEHASLLTDVSPQLAMLLQASWYLLDEPDRTGPKLFGL